MSKSRDTHRRHLTCTNVRFVQVEFPRQLQPRLVVEFSEGLSLLLEDQTAIPLAAEFIATFRKHLAGGRRLLVLNLTSAALKVFLALDPCDMRKSFNGLQQIAADQLQGALTRDALFVFTNKCRNRIKLLYFDGTGTWVATKRLEKGRFSWPSPSESGQRRIKLHAEALQLIIDGVDLRGASFKPWYERSN